MPIALPQPESWDGRDVPFSTEDEHRCVVDGQPFIIYDAKTFTQEGPDGPEEICAFLLQLLDVDTKRTVGNRFVWTRQASPSRLRIVEFVHEQTRKLQDVVGPCHIVAIGLKKKGMSPFYHITMLDDEAEPTASEPNINPDDIPF